MSIPCLDNKFFGIIESEYCNFILFWWFTIASIEFFFFREKLVLTYIISIFQTDFIVRKEHAS